VKWLRGSGNLSSFIPSRTANPIDTDVAHQFLETPEHPHVIALHEYWLAKRGERRFPDRADMSPSDFPRLLPNIAVVEVIDGGADFRFRLYGSELAAMTGRDRTGEYFSKLEAAPKAKIGTEETRAYWMRYGRVVLEAASPIFMKSALVPTATSRLTLHGLILPLTAGGTAIEQVIGGGFVTVSPVEA
jgi:hypothetical protein